MKMDKTTIEALPHPMDFSLLQKGQTIPPEVLEPIVECSSNDANYSLKLVALAAKIKANLGDRGEHVVIKQDNKSLRILTDEEASHYLKRANDRGLAVMARTCRELGFVDRTKLSSETLQKHEHSQLIAAHRVAGAIGGEKKALTLLDYKDTVPKLFGAGTDQTSA